ncbi:MAG: carbon starvation protein A [Bacteroidales bacterium]|nr:carbon starvation protein A [Bacteroidales bacterium]
MNAVLLVIVTFSGYIIAYRLYGKYLANRIFRISDANQMPADKFQDGIDYVPTPRSIVFGHHFTTIAGLGPIVGPAIGIIWGWIPALLWIFVGSIFMGAVHDFSTLVISARNRGQTIGELTGNLVSPGARFAFQAVMQLLLFIVLSVFAMIVSTLFMLYPASVIPVWFQIPIAIWLGYQLQNGRNPLFYSVLALLLMYASIVLGVKFEVDLSRLEIIQWIAGDRMPLNDVVTVSWCVILFIYVFIASSLPVQRLLQPRDYINSHQLLLMLLLLIIGIFIAHPVMSAPGINHGAFAAGSGVPDMMPTLFIIIACGAISGFHSIASSGTTVKQVQKESDTLFIGFGGMLTEGFLAVIVLIAIAAGLGMGFKDGNALFTGKEAFYHYYSGSQNDIGSKLESFISGSSNLLHSLGISLEFGRALMAVFIVSFANTTLDSAARMQRLSLQEIFTNRSGRVRRPFQNRYVATGIVVVAAAVMTFIKPGGQGAYILWPLFGSLNQLLAALGLAIVSVYLFRNGKNYGLTLVPMLFVLVMTVWSVFLSMKEFYSQDSYLLLGISCLIVLLTVWLMIESFRAWIGLKRRGNYFPDNISG